MAWAFERLDGPGKVSAVCAGKFLGDAAPGGVVVAATPSHLELFIEGSKDAGAALLRCARLRLPDIGGACRWLAAIPGEISAHDLLLAVGPSPEQQFRLLHLTPPSTSARDAAGQLEAGASVVAQGVLMPQGEVAAALRRLAGGALWNAPAAAAGRGDVSGSGAGSAAARVILLPVMDNVLAELRLSPPSPPTAGPWRAELRWQALRAAGGPVSLLRAVALPTTDFAGSPLVAVLAAESSCERDPQPSTALRVAALPTAAAAAAVAALGPGPWGVHNMHPDSCVCTSVLAAEGTPDGWPAERGDDYVLCIGPRRAEVHSSRGLECFSLLDDAPGQSAGGVPLAAAAVPPPPAADAQQPRVASGVPAARSGAARQSADSSPARWTWVVTMSTGALLCVIITARRAQAAQAASGRRRAALSIEIVPAAAPPASTVAATGHPAHIPAACCVLPSKGGGCLVAATVGGAAVWCALPPQLQPAGGAALRPLLDASHPGADDLAPLPGGSVAVVGSGKVRAMRLQWELSATCDAPLPLPDAAAVLPCGDGGVVVAFAGGGCVLVDPATLDVVPGPGCGGHGGDAVLAAGSAGAGGVCLVTGTAVLLAASPRAEPLCADIDPPAERACCGSGFACVATGSEVRAWSAEDPSRPPAALWACRVAEQVSALGVTPCGGVVLCGLWQHDAVCSVAARTGTLVAGGHCSVGAAPRALLAQQGGRGCLVYAVLADGGCAVIQMSPEGQLQARGSISFSPAAPTLGSLASGAAVALLGPDLLWASGSVVSIGAEADTLPPLPLSHPGSGAAVCSVAQGGGGLLCWAEHHAGGGWHLAVGRLATEAPRWGVHWTVDCAVGADAARVACCGVAALPTTPPLAAAVISFVKHPPLLCILCARSGELLRRADVPQSGPASEGSELLRVRGWLLAESTGALVAASFAEAGTCRVVCWAVNRAAEDGSVTALPVAVVELGGPGGGGDVAHVPGVMYAPTCAPEGAAVGAVALAPPASSVACPVLEARPVAGGGLEAPCVALACDEARGLLLAGAALRGVVVFAVAWDTVQAARRVDLPLKLRGVWAGDLTAACLATAGAAAAGELSGRVTLLSVEEQFEGGGEPARLPDLATTSVRSSAVRRLAPLGDGGLALIDAEGPAVLWRVSEGPSGGAALDADAAADTGTRKAVRAAGCRLAAHPVGTCT
eukprot:TRINITY_DN10547_c0_g1_i2.p1 TRINITY_DN10547_c0_g1~~TRINITY_DN10547_c0_g1_i2.p1  ORF type:complete len:1186 (+),score=138.66 TRINITY_DN10547_c0_g1_i2:92-3649(+)